MAEFLQIRKRKCYHHRSETLSPNYKKLDRFSEENVEWLAEHFLGEYAETRGAALSNKERMKAFLRYVEDPGFQNGIGEKMGIHQSSASKVIGDVMQNIIDKAHLWIKSPKSENEMRAA